MSKAQIIEYLSPAQVAGLCRLSPADRAAFEARIGGVSPSRHIGAGARRQPAPAIPPGRVLDGGAR